MSKIKSFFQKIYEYLTMSEFDELMEEAEIQAEKERVVFEESLEGQNRFAVTKLYTTRGTNRLSLLDRKHGTLYKDISVKEAYIIIDKLH